MAFNLKHRDFLKELDFTKAELSFLLDLARDLKRERYGAAISALLEGVRACPNNSDLWVYLGDSYYFSNENDKPTVQKAKDAYCKACNLGNSTGCEKCEQIGQILQQMRR